MFKSQWKWQFSWKTQPNGIFDITFNIVVTTRCVCLGLLLLALFSLLWNILPYSRFSHFPQVNKHFSHKHDKNLNYILLFAWWLTQFRWWKRLWIEIHNQRHLRKTKKMERWMETGESEKTHLGKCNSSQTVCFCVIISLFHFRRRKSFQRFLLLGTEVKKKKEHEKKYPKTFVLMCKYTDPAPVQIERCAC